MTPALSTGYWVREWGLLCVTRCPLHRDSVAGLLLVKLMIQILRWGCFRLTLQFALVTRLRRRWRYCVTAVTWASLPSGPGLQLWLHRYNNYESLTHTKTHFLNPRSHSEDLREMYSVIGANHFRVVESQCVCRIGNKTPAFRVAVRFIMLS